MSETNTPPSSATTEREDHRDLDELGRKLRQKQDSRETGKHDERPSDEMPNNGLGVGLRIGTELLVGVMVGLLIGWSFDKALGTGPWGLLIFFVLGFAAGILNVVRAANKAMGNSGTKAPGADGPED